MTVQEIRTMMREDPQYKFLEENPHLGSSIILLTLGGSHSYGLNTDTSDVDIRGVALEKPSDLIGLTRFDQVVDNGTDTTIYAFNKMCRYLMNGNPNITEMLGCNRDQYLFLSPIGAKLIENRKLFISKHCADSFAGYATQQLRRLENALARDRLAQAMKEKHIMQSMERAVEHFKDRYTSFDFGQIILYLADSKRDDLDKEVVMDVDMKAFPARQFNSMINDLKNVLDNYEKLNHRNMKKDDMHMNKHAMHLIRLYLMCLEILETGEVHTFRSKEEREFLQSIRNGKYMNEDGTYQQEFFDMVDDFEARLQTAKETSQIPDEPDEARIQEFIMEVNSYVINKKE